MQIKYSAFTSNKKWFLFLCLSVCLFPSWSVSSFSLPPSLSLSLSIYIYIYIYICVCVCVHVCLYVYVCICEAANKIFAGNIRKITFPNKYNSSLLDTPCWRCFAKRLSPHPQNVLSLDETTSDGDAPPFKIWEVWRPLCCYCSQVYLDLES